MTCRNCTANTDCPPPTPICNAAGLCTADTRTCTTDANCNTAIKEICFNSKCYAPGPWSPCRNSTATTPSCDNSGGPGRIAIVTNSAVTPRACYCGVAECTVDTDCPAAPSGTASPVCFITTTTGGFNFCRLDCTGGKTCPFGMTCLATTGCSWM
jgi:hypothetical protein